MADGNRNSIADTLFSDFAAMINSGELREGDRLPTERELASKYQASRAVVRRALEALEHDGRIIRHVGRGTFVSKRGFARNDKLEVAALSAQGHDVSPADLAVARSFVEPGIAEYAAIRATVADLEKIKECLLNSEAAEDSAGFDFWDCEMHTAIAKAAHNSFVMVIMDAINEVRRSSEWAKVSVLTASESRRRIHSRDHRKIVEALCSRDAAAARDAMQRHLDNIIRLMRGESLP